jgi:hypothetical protein
MPFLLLSAFLLFVAFALGGSVTAVWVMLASQLSLLVGEIRKGQVSGAGGFIFMSFLFFGVRPLYLVLEKDYLLVTLIYKLPPSTEDTVAAMWWATAALFCFAVGATLMPTFRRKYLLRRHGRNAGQSVRPIVPKGIAMQLLGMQMATLPVIILLARSGRALYSSSLGAYAYDFPVPMQALHVFSVVVILERWLRKKSSGSMAMLIASSALFLVFTWLMRDVSSFRGFYLTGVMVVGIAVLLRLKRRVSYVWLIVPIVIFQPLFQYLGEARGKSSSSRNSVKQSQGNQGNEGDGLDLNSGCARVLCWS